MKYLVKAIAVSSFVILPWLSVSAEQQTTPKAQPRSSMQGMGKIGGMGMGMMHMSDEHMRDMQEDMLEMHDIIDRINAEKDPAERERLKEEHLQMMKAHHAKMMQHRQKMMQQENKSQTQMHHSSSQKPQ